MDIKSISLALAVAATALSASTSLAQSARPVSLGISAGAAIPAGDFGNDMTTGFNGTVSLGFTSYGSPIGIRVDGMYNKFSAKDDFPGVPDTRIIGANANLVYSLPGTGIRPYLIGGGGIYGLKAEDTGIDQETDFGVNGGIGASFPLSGFNTFIEARFHHVFTENFSTQFIPVTFGISF
ncbi:MAG: outer membrane beta-barrel protein [Gemmatimonadaceae bacterium]|nr:outer membrane beta-barrel protein [Gemmatimonadaceae bacterium]MDQ3244202.1 outer membrane beta-barrel protein [Gemmatimonadota bacterium]